MRSFLCAVVAMSVVLVKPAGAAEENGAAALAWHFAGLPAMKKSNPGAAFNEIAGATNSLRLGDQIHLQVTGQLPSWIGINRQNLSAELVGPLLSDALKRETAARVEGTVLGQGNWVLAVALDETNKDLWGTTFLKIGRRLGLGEPQRAEVEDLIGWTIPASDAQRGFTFVANKQWFLVANAFAEKSTARQWGQQLAKTGRPVEELGGNWLTAEVHPEAIAWKPKLPFTTPISHVRADFSWQGKDIRTSARVSLARDLATTGDGWRIPKNIIRDPLVSFTAARGLKPFLAGLGAFNGLIPDNIPDQWFGWTLETVPFINDFAMPVVDTDAAYAHIEKSVPSTYNPLTLERALGQWVTATNASRMLWRGLPLFVPYLEASKDGEQGYLTGGIFPMKGGTNQPPAPAELFAQVESRKDLVYYDWEIAPARLASYNQAKPFLELFIPKAKTRSGTHGEAWLTEIQAKLGNVITEATRTGPTELSVTRKSQIGMTGFELWLFSRWLDSEEFPKFPYGMPKKPEPGKAPAGLPGGVPPRKP